MNKDIEKALRLLKQEVKYYETSSPDALTGIKVRIGELETVVKNCSIPDVSGISLEQLKLQKECYRERKERNGKSTAYGEAHTDEIREGVIDHLIALCNYR